MYRRSRAALPMRARRKVAYMSRRSYGRSGRAKTQAGKSINVFRYPFSTTTVAAKIPDGSATLSSAQRFQICEGFSCPDNGVGYIAIMPTLDTPIWYSGLTANTATDAPAASGTVASPDVVMQDVGSSGGDTRIKADTGTTTAGTTWKAIKVKGHVQNTNELAKWRLVSAALKISLINNSEANEGFFEAIRISTGIEQGGNKSANDYSSLLDELLEQYKAGTSVLGQFVDQPSYVSGKLRDINKYMFQCRPDGINHNFNANTDLVDNGFDLVLIRITGRTVTGSDAVHTSIIAHAVTNQEIVYTNTNTLSRFHTECQYTKTWEPRMHAKWFHIKAGYRTIQT